MEPVESERRRLGDFEIVQEIGRGGMGVVYEAIQLSLNRRVALKVLPPGTTPEQRDIERFQREAQAAALLDQGKFIPMSQWDPAAWPSHIHPRIRRTKARKEA